MIEPVDRKRCQAEVIEGNFMSFGGKRRIRCSNTPSVIAREVNPGKDGYHGCMSLCPSCLELSRKIYGDTVEYDPIVPMSHLTKVLDSPSEIPDGTYPGTVGGSEVKFIIGTSSYTAQLEACLKGIGISCEVTIRSGIATVTIHGTSMECK